MYKVIHRLFITALLQRAKVTNLSACLYKLHNTTQVLRENEEILYVFGKLPKIK